MPDSSYPVLGRIERKCVRGASLPGPCRGLRTTTVGVGVVAQSASTLTNNMRRVSVIGAVHAAYSNELMTVNSQLETTA